MKILKCGLLLMVTFLLVYMHPVAAGDIKVSPQMQIIVKNAPEELFYLDVIIEDHYTLFYNLLHKNNYDQDMLKLLAANIKEGQHGGMLNGTYMYMEGDIIGTKLSNGDYKFQYVGKGVPKNFKILTVTKSGVVNISQPIKKTTYFEKFFYDYETMSVKTKGVFPFYIYHYLFLIFPYLFVRFVTFKLCKLKQNKLYQFLICASLVELLIMSPLISLAIIYNGSMGQAVCLMLVCQVFFTYFESSLYQKKFKIPVLQAIGTTLLANVLACVLIVQIMQYEFMFLLM